MERALNAWRACSLQGSYTANPSTVKFNRSSLILYRIANITLHTNILDLQILAGLSRLMGRPVKPEMALNVQVQMSAQWSQSDGAVKAVHHALKLLTETLFAKPNYQDESYNHHFQRMDYNLDGVLHGKWCLYLATLTLWAWGIVTSNNPSREGSVSLNGSTSFGGSVKMEDGEGYPLGPIANDDQASAWKHAQAYLRAMMNAAPEKNGLATVSARTETRGLVIIIRHLLKDERWDLRIFRFQLC